MAYRFKITIDKTKVSNSNTNFVYLFSNLTTTIPAGFWTHPVDVDGMDIKFYDTNETTELKREIVHYSSGLQTVEAHVQIPTLSSAADKEIYCVYGDTPRGNDTLLWSDVNAEAVYHLENDCSDSSGNGNNGSPINAPSIAAGKIGGCASFDGTGTQCYDLGNDASIQLTHIGSLSAWFYITNTVSSHHNVIFGNSDFTNDRNGYTLDVRTGAGTILEIADAAGYNQCIGGAFLYPLEEWYLITATFDGSWMNLYHDGVLRGGPIAQTRDAVSNVNNTFLGKGIGTGNFYLEGLIDEARIYSSVLNSDWILTEHNNQNDPASFSSCGVEETYNDSSVLGGVIALFRAFKHYLRR